MAFLRHTICGICGRSQSEIGVVTDSDELRNRRSSCCERVDHLTLNTCRARYDRCDAQNKSTAGHYSWRSCDISAVKHAGVAPIS